MTAIPTPRAARTEELAAAFRLAFQHLGEPERDGRVARALDLLQQRELDPEGIFVLGNGAKITAVLVCLIVPGASALVWPPQSVADSWQHRREDALLTHAFPWLRQRGVKLAQALLSPDEVPLANSLKRNGFVHVTHLWYLRHEQDVPISQLDLPSRLTFLPYSETDAILFRDVLERTYEGSLDCPEVTGVRTMDEVLTGHRAQGRFDPDRWWLAMERGRPVGVLLVAEMPETGNWEVAYVGVIPEARGRKFGREMMLKALFEARAESIPWVTLSVDGRNRPAWQLYRDLGFTVYDRREVFLALWK
jgi:ribosomal protein S18 acetylase RimI-like enzyme